MNTSTLPWEIEANGLFLYTFITNAKHSCIVKALNTIITKHGKP